MCIRDSVRAKGSIAIFFSNRCPTTVFSQQVTMCSMPQGLLGLCRHEAYIVKQEFSATSVTVAKI